jgi:Type II secretion system (T2SS), protein M
MKPRDRLVLAILGAAGVIAVLWFFAVAPKRDEAKAVTAQVTAAEQRRDSAKQEAAVAEQAKASYRGDYATVARLGKAVPSKADVPSLVYQLENAARAAKVDFRSISVQSSPTAAPASPPVASPTASKGETSAAAPASSSAGIEPQEFQFTFQGNFFSLQRLLSEIDRFSRVNGSKVSVSGRLLTIQTVTLNPSDKGLPNIKAEIRANAYVADIPAALPGSSSPQASAGAAAPTTTTASEVAP